MSKSLKQRAWVGCYPAVLFRSESIRLLRGTLKTSVTPSRFETSILQEIICHDLALLKGSNSFQCKARLEKESPVPRKLADFLKQQFGRNPVNSATCNSAFLDPAGKCQRKDVVVLKNSELCVAHIWFHASFDDKIVSLVSLWEIQDFNKQRWMMQCLLILHKFSVQFHGASLQKILTEFWCLCIWDLDCSFKYTTLCARYIFHTVMGEQFLFEELSGDTRNNEVWRVTQGDRHDWSST